MIEQILIMCILLLLSGFFSGIESAFFSLSELKISHLAAQKVRHAELLKKLRDDEHRLLVTILIGNNLVNIGAASYATSLALGLFGNNAVGIVTGILTFMILVFGEIVPKSVAIRNNEMIALTVAPIIKLLMFVFWPIIKITDLSSNVFVRLLSSEKQEPSVTEEELKHIVNLGAKEGAIKKSEKEMITKIFRFDDTDVKQIMIPRTDMTAIDEKTKIKDVANLFYESGFSRIPVFCKNKDDIKGVVYIKDVFIYLKNRENTMKAVKSLMKPVIFVPETKKIDSLLKEFQNKKMHLAVVVDEHGGVSGLVTIEDILEEIVGEIIDESDEEKRPIIRLDGHTYLIRGSTEIAVINKKLKFNIAKEHDYETIGGFVLDKLGKIPKQGEKIDFGDFTIKVEKIDNQRIAMLKLTK